MSGLNDEDLLIPQPDKRISGRRLKNIPNKRTTMKQSWYANAAWKMIGRYEECMLDGA